MNVSPESPQQESASAPKGFRMSKALLNFVVDFLLLVSLLSLIWITAMLQVVFPDPTKADGLILWGWNYTQWRNVQFLSLCVSTLITMEHLVLHWPWICGIIATKILKVKNRPADGILAVYGVGFFIMVLVVMMIGIIFAYLSVSEVA